MLGAALSAVGFSVLVYAIIEAPDQGWTSGVVVGALAASIALLGAFVWWEGHTKEPMLNLGFFRSARFSVGTAAVSVAFFALLGAIFALTQYLQFAHGYSAIEAGAIMSPIALGLMMGAGSSSKAVRRLGTSRVVAAGLSGLAVLMALTTLWSPSTNALAARGLVLRACAGDGLGDGPGDRSGHRRRPGRQDRRRLGHQHRRQDGLGSARCRSGRLARQLPLFGRCRRLGRRVACQRTGGSRVLGRGRQCDIGPASTQRSVCPTRDDRRRLYAGDGYRASRSRGTGRRHGRHRDPLPAGAGVRRSDQPSREHRAPSRRGPSVRRKAGVSMFLVALVLGAAYLASRPGSDIPAANGQGSAPRFAAIERFVRGEMAAQRIPGLALGISENDRITYLRGFGKADDSGRPVTPTTPFIIGSLAKSFTALAIMQLVESRESTSSTRRCSATCRGSASRTRQLRPGSPSATSSTRRAACRPRPGRTFQGNPDISDAALEKTVRKLSSVELTAPVGQKHQYSTVNYSVLGLIVQTVAGRSYESYVQTEILDPLRMRGSFTSAAVAERHGLATGYHYWFGRPRAADLPVQPWARPGRLPDLRCRGHDPLPDRTAEPRSLPLGVCPFTHWGGRAPPACRSDTGSRYLVWDGLVRRADQRNPGNPSSGRDVQLPRERGAGAGEPDRSHRVDQRGELDRPVPERSHGNHLRGCDEPSRGTGPCSADVEPQPRSSSGPCSSASRSPAPRHSSLESQLCVTATFRPVAYVRVCASGSGLPSASAGRPSSWSSCRSSSACHSSSPLRDFPISPTSFCSADWSRFAGGSSERSGRTRRSEQRPAVTAIPEPQRPARSRASHEHARLSTPAARHSPTGARPARELGRGTTRCSPGTPYCHAGPK